MLFNKRAQYQKSGWIFVTECFKMIFLEISLSANYVDCHLDGHIYVRMYVGVICIYMIEFYIHSHVLKLYLMATSTLYFNIAKVYQ